jgi:hypothetical protein
VRAGIYGAFQEFFRSADKPKVTVFLFARALALRARRQVSTGQPELAQQFPTFLPDDVPEMHRGNVLRKRDHRAGEATLLVGTLAAAGATIKRRRSPRGCFDCSLAVPTPDTARSPVLGLSRHALAFTCH